MTSANQTTRHSGSISSPTAQASTLRPIDAIAGDQEPSDETSNFIDEHSVFEGGSICFSDKSQWQVQKPMSYIELQRTDVPCEARQVFSAICLEDPGAKHSSAVKAIMKIKFQVSATEERIDGYQDDIEEFSKTLAEHPKDEWTRKFLKRLKKSLRKCTQPTKKPNTDTIYELAVLSHLADRRCSSTPRLLGFELDVLPPRVHRKAVAGGYMIFVLMTKVPGRQLSSGYLWGLTPAERENLRQDFENALREVCRCGIMPHDRGLHNLRWDRANRKCYITDSEHAEEMSPKTLESLETPKFMGDQNKYWSLWEAYYGYLGIVSNCKAKQIESEG